MLNSAYQICAIIVAPFTIAAILNSLFPSLRIRLMGQIPTLMKWKWPAALVLLSAFLWTAWYFTLPSKKTLGDITVRGIWANKNNYGDLNPQTHSLIFWIEVFNHGKPSILTDWSLNIIGLDGKVTPAGLYEDQNQVTNVFLGYLYDPNDSIVKKTRTCPIASGGEQFGYVLALAQNIQRKYMEIPGTIFRITFQDIDGNTYTNDYKWPLPAAQ